jgi:DNA-binding XRE family transcriptional regulator
MGRQPPKVHDLEYHRQRCGYTQVDMTELLDVSRGTWHLWVRGEKHPRLTHQYRLAYLFHMPLSALWHPLVQEDHYGE